MPPNNNNRQTISKTLACRLKADYVPQFGEGCLNNFHAKTIHVVL